MIGLKNLFSRRWPYVVLILFAIGATASVTALLIDIFEKRVEERTAFVRVVEVDEDSTHTEMRALVCAQCHVEYYCSSAFKLTFPWGNGLSVEQTEKFWNGITLGDG